MTVHQIINAEEIVREWFGDGGHPDPRAQDRSDVCTGRLSGNPCPYNYLGHWIIPKKIADTIRRCVELKNHLKLRVEGEDKLGHCECCNCVLSLKVHVPRQTILNHTSDTEFRSFPPNPDHPKFHCWLRQEAYETTKPA